MMNKALTWFVYIMMCIGGVCVFFGIMFLTNMICDNDFTKWWRLLFLLGAAPLGIGFWYFATYNTNGKFN